MASLCGHARRQATTKLSVSPAFTSTLKRNISRKCASVGLEVDIDVIYDNINLTKSVLVYYVKSQFMYTCLFNL